MAADNVDADNEKWMRIRQEMSDWLIAAFARHELAWNVDSLTNFMFGSVVRAAVKAGSTRVQVRAAVDQLYRKYASGAAGDA